MNRIKVLAAYLPQFYETKENSEWWGEGYTDWVAVKKAVSVIKGQRQPRVPYNYYHLDKLESIKKQADIANKYGIYGFAIYHYWFSSQQNLLTKPAELIKNNKDINIRFFFVWDNNSWVNKTWKNISFSNQWAPKYEKSVSEEKGILAELKYGNKKEWKKHYDYLRQFFLDERYIKQDGCPVMGIFSATNNYPLLKKMCSYFRDLAKKDGFNGLVFISASNLDKTRLDYDFRYEPFCRVTIIDRALAKLKKRNQFKVYSYDRIWMKILINAWMFNDKKTIFGAFVRYDDTPRRGNEANVVIGETPEKFYRYMSRLISICKKSNKEYIYLTAWNEWGEGSYLEPDKESGYKYLRALKRAMDCNER